MVERIVQSRDYDKNHTLMQGATNNDSEINEEAPTMKAASAAAANSTPLEGPNGQLMTEKVVNMG